MVGVRLKYLFDRFVQQLSSKEEEAELMSLLEQPQNQGHFYELLNDFIDTQKPDVHLSKNIAASILNNILHEDKSILDPSSTKQVFTRPLFRIAAAAVLILSISALAYLLFSKKTQHKVLAGRPTKERQIKIVPGGEHAFLTLADGTTILLDSVRNGNIAGVNGDIKKKEGILIYGKTHSLSTSSQLEYNTVSTPRGGQYQIILSDGSKVWLNASSSLRFPASFNWKERSVELTGEAFFEVVKNSHPFYVKVNDMQVKVLGTQFNISAYPDQNMIKTSLLEGSVSIKKGSSSALLIPGQQGVVDKKHANINVQRIDTSLVTAWKHKLFQFHGDDLATVLREIGRWYDVDVEYVDTIQTRTFEGKISREAELSDVLKILELSGVKFTLKGRKIIVQ